MVINKNASKIQKFCVSHVAFFTLKFIGIVFLSSSNELVSASIILSHIITEFSVILTKYLTFSQLHVAGFQI